MDLLDELHSHVLCGDGAMGTLFLADGISISRCFEEFCVTEPDRVERIHRQYIDAGARVIGTNTFGANALRLGRFGFEDRVEEINRAAAQLAVRVARDNNVYVAGSIGPLGIRADEAVSRSIDRGACFREQIAALLEGGAQLIFFETFLDLEEMETALRARHQIDDGLTICSFACRAEGRLPSGVPLLEAFRKLRDLGADIVGVNCMNRPDETAQLLKDVPADYVLAAYPSAGTPTSREGRMVYEITPDDFARAALEMVRAGVRLIGGCCGTTPAHIAAASACLAKSSTISDE